MDRNSRIKSILILTNAWQVEGKKQWPENDEAAEADEGEEERHLAKVDVAKHPLEADLENGGTRGRGCSKDDSRQGSCLGYPVHVG